MSRFRRAGLAMPTQLVLALVLGAWVSDGEAQEAPTGAFGDLIEVRLIGLEVLVTDRDGRPVTDLTAEDFEIFDDGAVVDITHFAAPSRAVASNRTPSTPLPSAEPPAAVSSNAEMPLLVFYFDGLHLTRERRQPVLDALERFLWEQRVPAERVMVLNQSEGVQMHAPFGSSVDRLSQAVEEVADTKTSGRMNEADRGRMIRAVFSRYNATETAFRQGGIPGTASVDSSAQICDRLESTWRDQIQTFSEEASRRGATTLDHLRVLAGLLGSLPGSKVLVYVGGGLEIEPAVDVAHYVGRHCPGLHGLLRQATRPSNLDREFKNLVLDASSDRITFYTLEAAGVRPVSKGLAETGNRDFSAAAENQLLRSDNPQSGLKFLAEETGGRAVLETNRFDEPLRTLAGDLGAFYSLAYRPPVEPDGREHQVKVKVRDPRKLQLRYRRSYRNVAAARTLEDRLISSLSFGWTDNPLGIEIGYGEVLPNPEDAATYLVPLRFSLNLERLLALDEEDGSRARLRFLLAARDGGGHVLGPFSQHYNLALPSDPKALGEQTFEFMAEMVPGKQDLALGFVDEHSGEASFLTESLDLPSR